MSGEATDLTLRLAQITVGFFAANLGFNPERVNVLEEDEGGDFIVIQVKGFTSKAETALAEHLKARRILDEYYGRVLGGLSPMLSAAVEEVAQRPLLDCQTTFDLFRDECLYLLTLGTSEPRGSGSV